MWFCLVERDFVSGYMSCWLVAISAKGQTFQKRLRPRPERAFGLVALPPAEYGGSRKQKEFALGDKHRLISAGC
jgi:hypothetical protein